MSESQFVMISDWMVNGNINDFVKAYPGSNLLEPVDFKSPSSLQVHWQSDDLFSWEASLMG